MPTTEFLLDKVEDPKHRRALEWFRDRLNQEVPWPEPLEGQHLANKAKGIHKPAGLNYALSVRQSLAGPYDDAVHFDDEGRWVMTYAMEGSDVNYFTNRALDACRADKIPVGVLIQVKSKPNPRYESLGLGLVTDFADKQFTIRQAEGVVRQRDIALDLSVSSSDFDAANEGDARTKLMRAIAVRRGQPAFRRGLMRAYDQKCAISGCEIPQVLEAAHILPYMGDYTNHVQNGLLLRADLHTLFDLGLLTIAPATYKISLATELLSSTYSIYQGQKISLPLRKADYPSDVALARRLTY